MFQNVQSSGKLLNVAQMQHRLEQIVFEQIDTSKNWAKAQESLHEMQTELTNYFKNYLESNDDVLPTSNPYWALFMDTASKLLYFNGLVQEHLHDMSDAQQKKAVLHSYYTAAKCLPNNHLEDNEQFFEEIVKSYDKLNDTPNIIDKESKTLSQCLESYQRYLQLSV